MRIIMMIWTDNGHTKNAQNLVGTNHQTNQDIPMVPNFPSNFQSRYEKQMLKFIFLYFCSRCYFYSLSLIAQICSDVFGELFTPEYVEYLVQETNTYYGATNLDVDNVVFVHGFIDPWHAMGRLTDLNENSPAFVINGRF